MPGWTNRGKKLVLDYCFRREEALPGKFYLALCTDEYIPGPDTNVLGDLEEIAAGNGYVSGGYELTPGVADFDVITEDDPNDLATVEIKDVVWTASGGSIPSSGSDATYAVLTDDNATIANRQVLAWWQLTSSVSVGAPGSITLQNCRLRLLES